MVDFDSLQNKAQDFIEKNEDKIDENIEKVADKAGAKFGHADQIDKAADRLQDMTPDRHENK